MFGTPEEGHAQFEGISTEEIYEEFTANELQGQVAGVALASFDDEKLTLAPPVITIPEEGMKTDKNAINFGVSAPGAELINIYDQGSLILKIEEAPEGALYFTMDVGEGMHGFVVESVSTEGIGRSGVRTIIVDTTAPQVDLSKSILLAQEDGETTHVTASLYLSSDTDLAQLHFSEYSLTLNQDEFNTNIWSGEVAVSEDLIGGSFNVITLASVEAIDDLGNASITDVPWEGFQPRSLSFVGKYLALKANQLGLAHKLFSVTTWYFKILISFFTIALVLNIFIEIKKQHPHIIFSTIGIIGLLSMLIFV